MPNCAVYLCTSNTNAETNDISFHKIPKLDTEVGQKWLNFLRHSHNDSNWVPNKSAMLCRKHFTPYSFYKSYNHTRSNYLKHDSIPTIMPVRMISKASVVTKEKCANRKLSMLEERLKSADASDSVTSTIPTDVVEISDDDAGITDHDAENADNDAENADNDAGITDNDADITDNDADITDNDAEITVNDAEIPDNDAKTADAMVYIPGNDEEAMPYILKQTEIKTDPLNFDDKVPVNIVSSAKTVASASVKHKSASPDLKLLEKAIKLEKALARLETLSKRRLTKINTLRVSNRRLKKKVEKLEEENIKNAKELIIRDNMSVMDLASKPLVKQFLSLQRVCNGRRIFELS